MKTIIAILLLAITIHAAPNKNKAKIIKDSDGADCYIFTPNKIDPNKTYWLVVGVHGLGTTGKHGGGIAGWAQKHDCIVIGPTFKQGYQFGNGAYATKLTKLFKSLSKEYKLHDKMFLHGFSAGAQFVHRYAFNNHRYVGGVSAHSAGSWATGGGYGSINSSAKKIPFAISCGEKDTKKSVPQYTMTRLQWFKLFSSQMEKKRFDVSSKIIPNVAHRQSKESKQMAEECFKKAQQAFPIK